MGRGLRLRPALRRRPREALAVVGTIDFDDAIDATAMAATLRENGSSTPSRIASWAAISYGSGCSRRSRPADLEALTACIDWIVENADAR